MKKKGIATLALAGALAATMMPAFAASNTTSVGYTANGNPSADNQVMVTVPKSVAFTGTEPISGFDVKSYVWDATANSNVGGWQEANASHPLNKTITVSVKSTNGYKLKNNNHATVEGAYKYVVGSTTLTTTSGTGANVLGTLQDAGGEGVTASYTLAGTLTMTSTPAVDANSGHAYFGDTLTYTFTGLE